MHTGYRNVGPKLANLADLKDSLRRQRGSTKLVVEDGCRVIESALHDIEAD